jgi:hypothetical protein
MGACVVAAVAGGIYFARRKVIAMAGRVRTFREKRVAR